MGFSYHSAIIKDKILFVCGHNQYGQLGLGFNTPSSPYIGANVFTPLNGEWKMVACGHSHTLAIKEDGTLWAWGYNGYSQLGLGNTTDRTTPTRVGTDRWKMVACGYYYTLAIKEDGTLWAWGYNLTSQLGLGDTTDRNVPTQVGTDNDWKMVACGGGHTLAIKEDGTLWAWGNNGNGRLGLGDTTNRTTPTQVGTDKWKMVACGYTHTLAIKEDGTLWAWGNNGNGQLGLGDTTQRTIPTQIIDFEKVDLLMNNYFMYVFYYLIKSLDKFQTLLNDIWIEDIQITDPPTQEQFEQYGMRDSSVLSNDVSKVQFIKTKNILGDGMEYRWTVDRSQYGGIKTFEIKEGE